MNRRELLKGVGATASAVSAGCGLPTLGTYPLDAGLLAKIDTFVVLMMENRSFDHVLGARKLAEGHVLEGLTGLESNPDPSGNPVRVFESQAFIASHVPHSWDDSHRQWNDGANDGFVRVNAGPFQNEPMGYHVRSHFPVTWALADHFAVCDRWHSSVLGPTFPNRYHLHAATSLGSTRNEPLLGLTSIFDLLDEVGLSGRTYYHDLPFQTAYGRFKGLAGVERYFADAAAGALPTLSFIDPQFTGPNANDDHPPKDLRLGQALIGSVYAALAASPQWSRCLFILVYDEHGGFYDHVAPGGTEAEHPEFEQLGFRVPAIVAGPSVQASSVISAPFEHVSLISTLTRRFGLPVLNERVEFTADLSPCIDPRRIGTVRRAPRLPAVRLSRSEMRGRLAARISYVEHPEMQDIATAELPRTLDRRSDWDVIARVLEAGAALGAVELID